MGKIIGSVIMFVLGLLFLLKPELVWKIEHSWDTKDGKPSDGYIIFLRCVGVFAIVVGIVSFIVYILYFDVICRTSLFFN